MYDSIQDLLQAYRSGERPKLRFDHHALNRGVEMAGQLGLSPVEIREAMFEPFIIGFSEKHQAVLLSRLRCTLSVCLNYGGNPCVVTILWATVDLWRASYEKSELTDRGQRALDHLRY